MRSRVTLSVVVALGLIMSACAGAATPTAAPVPPTSAPQPTAVPAQPTQPSAPTAAPATPTHQLVFGFSGANMADEYQIDLAKGFQDEANTLGVQLIHIENGDDAQKQKADIEDMIAKHVDALILQARDADAIVTSIQEADAAHIPVFMVDQGSNGGDFISLGGNDNYCMGYRGMETLIKLLNGKGKVMHITGMPGTLIVTWNASAVMQTMLAYPSATLVNQSYANWKADEAMRDVEDVLTRYPDLAGIYVHSEVMTPGVVQALKARNLVGKVLVVSGGTDPESLQELKNNEIQATVSWDSYAGAQRTLKAAYDYMTKGIVPPRWNPWVIYMNYADGSKVPIDCPIPGWDPYAGKNLPPVPTPAAHG